MEDARQFLNLLYRTTYTYFSMNSSVTATGMQVEAKTDSAFLIISAGTTLVNANNTTATGSMDAELYPTHPIAALSSTNVATTTNWGTATSTDPDDANVEAELTPLSAGATLTNYVAKQSYMVGLFENSASATNPLRMKSITFSSVNTGITAVVVCGSNLYSYTTTNSEITGATLAAADLITITGVQVDVYVYIDGANENVKTTNALALTGTIQMVYTIDAEG